MPGCEEPLRQNMRLSLFECLSIVSFPQAKRAGNPSGKIPDKPE